MYAYLDRFDNLDPHADDNCQKLAEYLGGGLNYAIARRHPDARAVRAFRSYDDVKFDLSCLPLLKVYRTQETADRAGVVETNLNVVYAMGMPDEEQLPGILHWVARILVAQINYLSTTDRSCGWWLNPDSLKISIEYRIMANQAMQPVYVYLKLSLKAKEIC